MAQDFVPVVNPYTRNFIVIGEDLLHFRFYNLEMLLYFQSFSHDLPVKPFVRLGSRRPHRWPFSPV
jgi:hypothetical protein